MQNQQQMKQGYVLQQSIAKGISIGNQLGPNYINSYQNMAIQNQQKLNSQLIYEGDICTLVLNIWNNNKGTLTYNKFMDKYNIQNISKIKCYRDPNPQIVNSYMIKININQKEHFFAAKNETLGQWFNRIIWTKLVLLKHPCDIQQQFINVCGGDILKKGQIFGGWQQRYVMITPKDGLMSYRDRKQSPTLIIQQAKQIWTRFQFVHGSSFLVIKIKNLLIKEEFGIPTNHAIKWLRAFYSLLRKT